MPKVQDPAEEMKSCSYCGCASPLVKEGRSWDWQAAKSIFNGDIITDNNLQPRQYLNGFSGQALNPVWFT